MIWSIWFVFNLLLYLLLSIREIRGYTLPDGVWPWAGPLYYIFNIFFFVQIGVNVLIIIFTFLLVKLHIKLKWIDMTAYEYLVFQSDVNDWKKAVKRGEMEKEEMDEWIKEITS